MPFGVIVKHININFLNLNFPSSRVAKEIFQSVPSLFIFTEWIVIFSKDQEGSVYLDKKEKKGKFVSPGAFSTYKWFVPKRSAPGSKDSSCVTWSYYSAVDSVKDTNSGLLGPLIICRKVHDIL